MATSRLFYGRIEIESDGGIIRNGDNGFIRIRFDVANGATTLTNVTDVSGYFGIDYIVPGTRLIASTQFPTQVTVLSVDTSARTLEVSSGAAAAGTNRLARISPSEGSYFIESGSIITPSNFTLDYNDITGSQESDFDSSLTNQYGIIAPLALSSAASTTIEGQFAQYPITHIVSRIINNQANFYISGSIDGINSEPEGYVLTEEYGAGSSLGINELSPTASYGTIFAGGDVGLASRFGFAPYQISVNTVTDQQITITGSSGGSGSGNGFPFSGSVASITGSLSITDGTLSIPGFANVSASLASISGSDNALAFTSASVNLNEITFNQQGGTTLTFLIDTGSVFSTAGTGIISSSAQISASGFLTSASAAQLGFGSGGGSSYTLTNTDIAGLGVGIISSSQGVADLRAGIISSSAQIELLGFSTGSDSYIHTQSSAATTWTINHNLNQQYSNITVYDGSDQVVLPSTITATNANTTTVTFPTAQSGYAVIGTGGNSSDSITQGIFAQTGSYYSTTNDIHITGSFGITGFSDVSASLAQISSSLQALASQSAFVHIQSIAATTWSVAHNNGNQWPTVTVYDGSDRVVIPEDIIALDANNMEVVFPTPQTGYVAVQAGQSAFLSSLGANTITGSLEIEPVSLSSTEPLLSANAHSASFSIASDGVMSISTDNGLPPAVLGGIVFSGSALYIGTD